MSSSREKVLEWGADWDLGKKLIWGVVRKRVFKIVVWDWSAIREKVGCTTTSRKFFTYSFFFFWDFWQSDQIVGSANDNNKKKKNSIIFEIKFWDEIGQRRHEYK